MDDDFSKLWKATSRIRNSDVKTLNAVEFLAKWKYFKEPKGYLLVSID